MVSVEPGLWVRPGLITDTFDWSGASKSPVLCGSGGSGSRMQPAPGLGEDATMLRPNAPPAFPAAMMDFKHQTQVFTGSVGKKEIIPEMT